MPTVNLSEEGKGVAAAFPYLMVLASVFLGGFTFLFTNGPLLWAVVRGTHQNNVAELGQNILTPAWSTAVAEPGGVSRSVLLALACVLVGFVVQNCAAIAAHSWAMLGNRRHVRFFTPRMYSSAEHPALMVKLQSNRTAKLEWEWHLFRFWIGWGLALNAVTFSFLCLWLTSGNGWARATLILALLMLLSAIQTSRLMYAMHVHAKKLPGRD
jgi:hypothetical protein